MLDIEVHTRHFYDMVVKECILRVQGTKCATITSVPMQRLFEGLTEACGCVGEKCIECWPLSKGMSFA